MSASELNERILERLVTVIPSMAAVLAHPDGKEEIWARLENSSLTSFSRAGLDCDDLEDQVFIDLFFKSPNHLYETVWTSNDWEALMALPDPLTALMAWEEWQYSQAFLIFSEDYEVDNLSEQTVGRWENFTLAWGGLTLNDRRAALTNYLSLAATQDPAEVPRDFTLMFALEDWPGKIEVPWVENKWEYVNRAVVVGADGKKVPGY